jgi:plasmid stabilization system protein ParE
MRVRYTPRAVRDLRSIFAYIEKESPPAAGRVVERIESVAAELSANPLTGAE